MTIRISELGPSVSKALLGLRIIALVLKKSKAQGNRGWRHRPTSLGKTGKYRYGNGQAYRERQKEKKCIKRAARKQTWADPARGSEVIIIEDESMLAKEVERSAGVRGSTRLKLTES